MTNENEVTNPLKDTKPIDLNGIMNIAGSLLKNPEVLNTVTDVMKLTNNVQETSQKPEESQKNTLTELQKQIEEINQQIIALQNQTNKQNEELKELILKMQSSLRKRRWWRR